MTEILISASLLGADPLRLAEEVASLEEQANFLHVDVMDFHFAHNGFGTIPMVARLKQVSKTPIEVHLMAVEQHQWAIEFAEAGADRIILHAESAAKPELTKTAKELHKLGVETVLALLHPTKSEQFLDVFAEFDAVLLVTVPETGFGAQTTLAGAFTKAKHTHTLMRRDGINQPLAVDGGIGAHNVREAIRAGATELVIGSDIFNRHNRVEHMQFLKNIITSQST